MPSISSKRNIQERILQLWKSEGIWDDFNVSTKKIHQIQSILMEEYKIIPDKERIGKGMVFITKTVAEGLLKPFNLQEIIPTIRYSIKNRYKEILDKALEILRQ